MLLGPSMPAPYADWRFVEADLYDTVSRVREYDDEARLVRQDLTGHLAIARWHRTSELIRGGTWLFARQIHDLDTDEPLSGEPDGRVIHFMRATDSHRISDMDKWIRRVRRHELEAEARKDAEIIEGEGDHAERMVHAMRRDAGLKRRAFISREEAA
jgi:hypothetical protein